MKPANPEPQPPAWLSVRDGAVWISVKVQPRAPRNQIVGPAGDELKIKIAAPPVDSAANEALLQFLAETLDLPRGKVQLIRGGTSTHKLVQIVGIPPAKILAVMSK